MDSLASPGASSPVPTFKLLLMGDSGVGKSSILLRFVEDKFLGEEVHAATIGTIRGEGGQGPSQTYSFILSLGHGVGVDFKVKFVEGDGGQRVKLTIWDTAGQERFRTLTSSYYRGAHGVILVYDVTCRESFVNAREIWMRELQTYADPGAMVLMLVANKVDRASARQVTSEEGQLLAKELAALYMECSAKTRLGIGAAFSQLVSTIMHSPRLAAARREAEETAAAQRRLAIERRREGDSGEPNGPCAC